MAGPSEIDVWQGDIGELEVDAVVVPANESLFMTAGAAAGLKRLGGEEIERAAVEQGPVGVGTAVVTPAGSLPSVYVIHAVGVGHDRVPDREMLARAVRVALGYAHPLQLRRMAFALVGVEHGAFEPADAAAILLGELSSWDTVDGYPEAIVVATANAVETRAAGEALARHRAGIA